MRSSIPLFVALVAVTMGAQVTPKRGEVHGFVRFTNDYPAPERLKVTQDFEVCGTTTLDETFVVSKTTRGLQNAVITLVAATGGGGTAPPSPAVAAATISQEKCHYGPHVQLVRPGTEIEIVNKDPLLHNVHAYLEADTLFNLAQPQYRKIIKQRLEHPGIVHFKCDVHSWMEAYVVVTNDPHVVLTDEEGEFHLNDVPPGTYTVRLWHEELGTSEKQVVVTAGGIAEVNFEIGG